MGKISEEAMLYVDDLILFCAVFPYGYEFTKDMLVWQWIAEQSGNDKTLEEMVEEELVKEIMEQICIQCFSTLLNMEYIVPSGYDYHFDQMKYKVGDKLNSFLQKLQLEPKFQNYVDSEKTDVTKVEQLSLASKEIDHFNFDVLKQCSHLQTLIIHRCYGSKLRRLPVDLFLELKSLKNLNLSYTNIVELPSSVEYLMDLRFLDLSKTPIMWLPESICSLGYLLTLKLDGCLSLTSLPRSTNKLFNLRHLVLNVVRQLESMPEGIGKLTKLLTLQAFLVGEHDGSHIGELKMLNKLRGSLCILNLENVMTKEDATDAQLHKKRYLKKIELQWSDLRDEKNLNEEEILQCLEPPLSIQELKIFFYSGEVLPKWISSPLFNDLTSITLYRCRYCNSLPSLGELPSLKLLNILENNEVIEIDHFFCRKQDNRDCSAFPKLEKLTLDYMSKLERWTGVENNDFPLIRHLSIKYCPKFVGLPLLCHMTSLHDLVIQCCPELLRLPEDGLPPALECLMINDCPKLKEQCGNERCKDWSKVAHVPDLYVDHQKVST